MTTKAVNGAKVELANGKDALRGPESPASTDGLAIRSVIEGRDGIEGESATRSLQSRNV